jgi:hypothetical protein
MGQDQIVKAQEQAGEKELVKYKKIKEVIKYA